MSKRTNKIIKGKPIWLTFIGLIGLGLLITVLLRGNDVALLNPKGVISGEQRRLLLISTLIMLELAIPTLAFLYYTAWKYRETNEKATYSPDSRHSKLFVFSIWAVPFIFMVLLATIMWPATHKLAPQKSVDSEIKPITIQVIAMRWKWLFIYPEQGIATVNFVQIPTKVPVQFVLTADETPMSSFWIPHLAGQLYAMTGHVNRLNLMAETPGDYTGSSAEINGAGFAGMKFNTRVRPAGDFNAWVQDVKLSTGILDAAEYRKLLVPSENHKPTLYPKVQPGLYDTMLMKYTGSHNHHAGGK